MIYYLLCNISGGIMGIIGYMIFLDYRFGAIAARKGRPLDPRWSYWAHIGYRRNLP